MRFKAAIMDEVQMRRSIIRISHEIIEINRNTDNLVLIGIHKRGLPLAEEIATIIRAVENKNIPVGGIEITLSSDGSQLKNLTSEALPFSIDNADVILVNDVLYTGRTVSAAIDMLSRLGKPRTIQLAVLIDRGKHELPIGANYVGKNIPTSYEEVVSVSVNKIDGCNKAEIYSIND